MKKNWSEEELKEIERQLSEPEGVKGLEMAKNMNETNITMTQFGVGLLNLEDHQHILEIGHGNAGHLEWLLNQASGIHYTGIERSKTMFETAGKEHTNSIKKDKANFVYSNSNELPFAKGSFDAILTVNTVYFWNLPEVMMQEIHRLLKPKGKFVNVFAHKDFMEQLPFVQHRFQLYNETAIQQLVDPLKFEQIALEVREEEVKSKLGDQIKRKFVGQLLRKKHTYCDD